jgi:hypothetical protein
MHIFVGQQAGFGFARGFIHQAALVDAAVVGLVMLQAEVRHVIAHAVEEVVVAVMMRAEKFVGLLHQILVMVPNFLRRIERGSAVGGNVHLGQRVLRQRYDFQELAGNHGRIDERGQGHGGEVDFVSIVCFAIGSGVPNFQPSGSFRLAV